MCSTLSLHLTWQYSICSEQWHFAFSHLPVAYCAYFITRIKFGKKRCVCIMFFFRLSAQCQCRIEIKHHTRREPVLFISTYFAFVFCWNCQMLNNGLFKPQTIYTLQMAATYFSFITFIMKLIFINRLLSLQVIIHPNLCPDTEECSEESSWMNTRPIA